MFRSLIWGLNKMKCIECGEEIENEDEEVDRLHEECRISDGDARRDGLECIGCHDDSVID